MKIRLAPHARQDLDAIWIFLASESGSESIAARVIQEISSTFALFARFPFVGRSVDSERHREVRTFAVDRYIIFYRPAAEEIRILRVIHASRDAFALFERR